MSMENRPPYGDAYEAADDDAIRVLSELARSALECGNEVLVSTYEYQCAYGRVVFNTRTSNEDDEPLTISRIFIFGQEEDEAASDMLLEYSFAPDGQVIEGYICGGIDRIELESYRARCEIGDICRTIMIEEELNRHETMVLAYFKQLAAAAAAPEMPSAELQERLGNAIAQAMRNRLENAEHVVVRNYSAIIDGRGNLEVTGYRPIAGEAEDDPYPEFEIELYEPASGQCTAFIMPAEGEGEPEMLQLDSGRYGLDIYEDAAAPTKQAVEYLSTQLASALLDNGLLQLEALESADTSVITQEHAYGDADNLLVSSLDAASLYFRLFLRSGGGENGNQNTFLQQAITSCTTFRGEFEATYQLQSGMIDDDIDSAVTEQSLFVTTGRNRLTMHIPYFLHFNKATGGYEIIETDEDDLVDFHYVDCGLSEIDDGNGKARYQGISLSGYVEIGRPRADMAAGRDYPEHQLFLATVPLGVSRIVSSTTGSFN